MRYFDYKAFIHNKSISGGISDLGDVRLLNPRETSFYAAEGSPAMLRKPGNPAHKEISGFELGNTTNIVTPFQKNEPPPTNRGVNEGKINICGGEFEYKNFQVSRAKKYKLQGVASNLLPGERVGYCMRHIGYEKNRVEIKYDGVKAHYSGLAVCGSVWNCPVCASRITEGRKEEMIKAVEGWEENGGSVIMVTFTLQHDRSDNLVDLLLSLNDAFRRMKMGNPWGRIVDRFKIIHFVTGLEVTYGENGWHPHKHMLLFVEGKLEEDKLLYLQDLLYQRYEKYLKKYNSSNYVHPDFGVVVSGQKKRVKGYLVKWGLEFELTKSPVKKAKSGGVSPFELLELYADGGKWAGELFKEYATVFKGKRQLVWSKGAKQSLGIEDREDVDILQDQEDRGEIITWLYEDQWAIIRKKNLVADLLNVSDRGQYDEIWNFLLSVGVRPVDQEIEGYIKISLDDYGGDVVQVDRFGFPLGYKNKM